MKLKLISEVFRQPSLEGIKIKKERHYNNFDYNFQLNGIEYYVSINELYQHNLLDYIASFIKDEQIARGVIADISLTFLDKEGQDSFDLTNAGNPFAVYNKLIACILHYTEEIGPVGFDFYGFNRAQDLMYDKLFKYLSKLYPEYQYIRLSNRYYIRKDVADMIETLKTDWSDEMSEFEDQLNHIKKEKIAARSTQLSNPSPS